MHHEPNGPIGPVPKNSSAAFKLEWRRRVEDWGLKRRHRERLILYVEQRLLYETLRADPDLSPNVTVEVAKTGRALFKMARELERDAAADAKLAPPPPVDDPLAELMEG